MPFIDISYDDTLSQPELRQLADALPEVLAEALDCPEDPHVGPPEPGDIEIRFRSRGPLDVGGLNCVVEVRTRLFPSRVDNKQERAELIRNRLTRRLNQTSKLGVWLILSEGAWAQS